MADETQPAIEPTGEQQGGDKPVQQGKFYTDDELQKLFGNRLKEDRETLEKQLGLSDLGLKIKDVKDILKAKKEADEAKKSELERLTGERDAHKTAAEKAVLEAAKVRALAKAGADPSKIDSLMKRVVGSTPEEIEADVTELIELGLIAKVPPLQTRRLGDVSNPANPTGEEKPLDEQIRTLEAQALKTGNQRDWAAVNRLKARKYQK